MIDERQPRTPDEIDGMHRVDSDGGDAAARYEEKVDSGRSHGSGGLMSPRRLGEMSLPGAVEPQQLDAFADDGGLVPPEQG